jgi:2-dehydro-3-deoxygalactonokinase
VIISVDWGISSLRVRLLQQPFALIAERHSSQGIKHTFDAWHSANTPPALPFYLKYLDPLIAEIAAEVSAPLDGVPMIMSGMAASSIGFAELRYATLPFSLDGSGVITREFCELRNPLTLVSGVASDSDVMRNEEIELIGLSALGYGDGLYIIPGTHSKHAHIVDGQLVDFCGYMTGEMFALLRSHSIISASVADGEPALNDRFRAGVNCEQPLLQSAISVRASDLLHAVNRVDSLAYLSGVLIGCELRNLSTDVELYLAGSSALQAAYAEALRVLQRDFLQIPQTHATLAVAHGHLAVAASGSVAASSLGSGD